MSDIGVAQRRPAAHFPRGFTLIELLVVIGIIAILISVLLPVLGSARKASYKTKCLSNMRQLGDAYKMYQLDNKGWWPPAWQTYKQVMPPYSSSGYADKRWHDFVGKYVIPKNIGELNFNGTQHTDPDKSEPQIWTEPIWHGDNPIWGCPVWERVSRDVDGNVQTVDSGNAILFPGYQQNPFPMTPRSDAQCVSLKYATSTVPGGYFKYTQWSRQGERALLFESLSHSWGIGATTWPFKPEGATDFPMVPNRNYGMDFNRHGKRKTGNKPNDPSLNVLFCDGHVDTVSARQAWKAIRMD